MDEIVLLRRVEDLRVPPTTVMPCLVSYAPILRGSGWCDAFPPVIPREPGEPERCAVPVGAGGRTGPAVPIFLKW